MATIQPLYDPLLLNKANGTPIASQEGGKRKKRRRSRKSRKHSKTQKNYTHSKKSGKRRKTGRRAKKQRKHTRKMRGGKLAPANFATAHSQNVSTTNPVNDNPTMSTIGNGSNSGTASYSINTNITPMESALAQHNVIANPAI